MSTSVKNIGCMEDHEKNTNLKKSFGTEGTVRFVFEGVEWSWGPNETKTLEDRIANAAVAADSRLRIMDSRDGSFGGQARS